MKKLALTIIYFLFFTGDCLADNTGFYNGFANQEVSVECQELSGVDSSGVIDVISSSGQNIYNNNFSIIANGVIEIRLPTNLIKNTYGSYTISTSGNFSCHSMFYRFEDDGQIDFAYSLPEINKITGISKGIFNSHNPNAVAPATQNWKTIFNASNNPFDAWLEVYDQTGELIDSIRIEALPAGQRIDIPLGHSIGEMVGIYRVVPDNLEQEYSSFLLRMLVEENDFVFAFPMLATKALSDSGLLNASTMAGAANWAEIANTSSQAITASLEIFNRFGELIENQNLNIAARAQTHIYLNQFIGNENVGSFRVRSSEPNLLISSLYYGQSNGKTTWAYASQAHEQTSNTKWSVIANKNYNAFNWLKVQSASLEQLDFMHHIFSSITGERTSFSYSTSGSLDLNHLALSSQIGKAEIEGNIDSHAELIKVFVNNDGSVKYITNVRPSLITEDEQEPKLSTDDLDEDGVINSIDNCTSIYNPEQNDFNENGIGDECDSAQYILNSNALVETVNVSGVSLTTEKKAIQANEVAVLVNIQDPQSVEVANYYVTKRQIPEENIIELSFATGSTNISPTIFNALKSQVDEQLDDSIQAIAISWTNPWQVGRMSLTSAFALGYNTNWYGTCGEVCCITGQNLYRHSSAIPFQNSGIRLVSMLAAETTQYAKELIDRSVLADNTFPTGDGHLVRTTDSARSVRFPQFQTLVNSYSNSQDTLSLFYQNGVDGQGNLVSNTDNIIFYMTGSVRVADLETNTYLPGSFADHMTSAAGRITGPNTQMSALRWLEAGASGSFGTVVEPCAYPQKFPNAQRLIPFYFSGATLAQAMWHSVSWPGEGLFLGDPLTKPWGTKLELENDDIEITTTSLRPHADYLLLGSDSKEGPYNFISSHGVETEKFIIISNSNQYSNYLLANRSIITEY